MNGQGEKVLRILVAAESESLYSGQTWIGTVALRTTGSSDGRTVRGPLARLVDVGLIERVDGGRRLSYRPTERGRKVDRILDEVRAARGGKFRPLREVLEPYEILAIR